MKKLKILMMMLMIVPLAAVFAACGKSQCEQPHCDDGNCAPLGQCNCGDDCQCNIVAPVDKDYRLSSFKVDGKSYTADKFDGFFIGVLKEAYMSVAKYEVAQYVGQKIYSELVSDGRFDSIFFDDEAAYIGGNWDMGFYYAIGGFNFSLYETSADFAEDMAQYFFSYVDGQEVSEDFTVQFDFERAVLVEFLEAAVDEFFDGNFLVEVEKLFQQAAYQVVLESARNLLAQNIAADLVAALESSGNYAELLANESFGNRLMWSVNDIIQSNFSVNLYPDRVAALDKTVKELFAGAIADTVFSSYSGLIEDEAAFRALAASAVMAGKLGDVLLQIIQKEIMKCFKFLPSTTMLDATGEMHLGAKFTLDSIEFDVEFTYVEV